MFRGGAVPAIQIEAIKPPKRIARGTARRHEVKLIRIGALEAAILDANEANAPPASAAASNFDVCHSVPAAEEFPLALDAAALKVDFVRLRRVGGCENVQAAIVEAVSS